MARHRWRGVAALTAVFSIGGGAPMVLVGEGGVLQHKGRRGVRYRPPIRGRTSMDGAHRGGERMATVAPTAAVALRWRGWTGGKGKRWRVTCGPVGRRKKKEGGGGAATVTPFKRRGAEGSGGRYERRHMERGVGGVFDAA
jgi:hypothetical protein